MRTERSVPSGAVASALALLAALAAATGAQEPVFLARLDVPVIDDSIAYPTAVTVDGHGDEVFVCDTRKNRIVIFDGAGLFRYEIAGGDIFSAPRDIAVDPDGLLLVLANHERRKAVLELDFDGLFLREVSLGGLPEGSLPPRIVSLALSPSGDRLFALDEANLTLWISDRQGDLLGSVDLAAGLSESDRQDLILGHVDVYGDNVLIAVPSAGQILHLTPDGELLRRVGQKGGGSCKLGRPAAAALEENGELIVVDRQRMVLMRWSGEQNRCLGEYLGIGVGPGRLYYPFDLALDGEGRSYITQGFEGRVQVYEGLAPAAGAPASSDGPRPP